MLADNVRRLERTMHDARAAGYNGIVLDDYKFQILDSLAPGYFRNLASLKNSAAKLGLDLYPSVARFGYSNGILSHDPNLAEGVQVVRAPLRAQNGAATLVAAPPMQLSGDQMVPVSRFRQYHLSVSVKTANFQAAEMRSAVLMADGGRLAYFDRLPAPTQDWTTHHVVFNSVDNDLVNIRPFGWLRGSGDYNFKDATLQEVALVNAIRREAAPLVVTSADGATTYEEGHDFEVENHRPLGLMPRPGEFDAYHQPPRLIILPNSRISEGETVSVSYYHALAVREGGVMCCLSEPTIYDVVAHQVARLQDLLQPKGFFISIDEVRVANWCEKCRRRSMTPGKMLADAARRCIQMIRDASPSATILIWSDMFDPFHNAHEHYYIVNGDLAGSWHGLDKDVVIATWNFTARDQSLKWFASLGHSQVVAGFYDRPISEMAEWSRAAAGVPGISGAMYTTWRDDYSQLGKFAELMWNRIKV